MATRKKTPAKTTKFYGNTIKKGILHKKLGVALNKKIPMTKINAELKKLKAIKNKTVAQKKFEKELIFAKNAKKWK